MQIAVKHSKPVGPNPVAEIHDAELLQNLFLSPVARIPPEILVYVFQLYVDARDEFTPVTVSPQGPRCLVQVCQLWRAITDSDPRLWTSVHFYFPETHESHEEDVRRVQPVFDLHLERSGTLPISLTFIDHRIYSRSTIELVGLLVNRLRAHSYRWRHISLHLSRVYFPLLSIFTLCGLLSLRHLHLSGDVQERFIYPPLNLESATNLKSLAYGGSSRSLDGTIHAHWEGLAEVSFDFVLGNPMGIPFFQQFTHLAQCRNITTCSLGINQTLLNGDQAITLLHLQTLRVRRLSGLSDATFLDALILPQLQTLEIDSASLIGSGLPWHHRNFSNLLARSGCTLRHLSIQDVEFPSDEVVRCLVASHALTSLRFIPYPRSQDITNVIHALDVSRGAPDQTLIQGHEQIIIGNGPLLAELREVMLATSQEGCLDLIMAMLRSRAEKVVALRRVEVEYFYLPHRQGDQLERVAAFRRELAQWVSEIEAKNGSGDWERLEASVVIDSPYFVEYINVE